MSGRPSWPVACAILPLLCHGVVANTEIINFISGQQRSVDLPQAVVGNWATLNFSNYERQWALQPAPLGTPLHEVCKTDKEDTSTGYLACPHEIWVVLDLDDTSWGRYDHRAFTLRLSWPASTPADFLIDLYSPESVLALLSPHKQQISTEAVHARSSSPSEGSIATTATYTKYARIRAVDSGVPTPEIQSGRQPDARSSYLAVKPIAFILILERLYWGVLPASMVPTVFFLALVLLAAAMAVPWTIAYLDPFILQAREDLMRRAAFEKKGQ
ncbi:hypothetical protein ID866_6897 [Astraeus odoratus]|nr:hypothetical protein ID866_6897 [Astraeus odoratus]